MPAIFSHDLLLHGLPRDLSKGILAHCVSGGWVDFAHSVNGNPLHKKRGVHREALTTCESVWEDVKG